MCVCILGRPLPGKAGLRPLLRNSGVAAEVNTGQRTAGFAFRHRRRSYENWGRTVQEPTKKYEVQRQGNAQPGGLTFWNCGMELREHWSQAQVTLYSTHYFAKINKVRMYDSPLHTARLLLRPAKLSLAIADLEGRSRFAQLLEAEACLRKTASSCVGRQWKRGRSATRSIALNGS